MSNVVVEAGAPSFRGLLSATNDNRAMEIPDYGLFAVVESRSIYLQVGFKEYTASAEAVDRRLSYYIGCRLEGHSVEYATDSLKELRLQAESGKPNLGKEQPARRVLVDKEDIARRHHIPLKWLQQSSNDLSYFVVDGPVVWEYNNSLPWKRDARELDPAFASKLDQVCEEVKKTGWKATRDYYDEIWRLMKQRHNVEWLTPRDLNPGVNIDFAPPSPKP